MQVGWAQTTDRLQDSFPTLKWGEGGKNSMILEFEASVHQVRTKTGRNEIPLITPFHGLRFLGTDG